MQETFRIKTDEAYANLLGQAIYIFTWYELATLHTGEKLKPGFIQEMLRPAAAKKGKPRPGLTSGEVAKKLLALIDTHPGSLAPDALKRLKACAAEFGDLAEERNKLLHAHPFTAEGGAQRMLFQGRTPDVRWDVTTLRATAEKFDAAACELNALCYELWPA